MQKWMAEKTTHILFINRKLSQIALKTIYMYTMPNYIFCYDVEIASYVK